MKNQDKKLQNYMAQFPSDATSWGQATDEMRDLAREVRMTYNELIVDAVEGDENYVEGLDFMSFSTPSEWNTKAKIQIASLWGQLTDYAKDSVLEDFNL